MYSQIFRFNREVVGVQPPPSPSLFSIKERDWLVTALREEAQELSDSRTVEDQVDALVDSIIFAVGGLFRMGLTESQAELCLNAVMEANFTKRSGVKPGRVFEGVRDAVKPKDWVAPEARIRGVLNV